MKISSKIDIPAKAEKSTKRQPASVQLGFAVTSWEQKRNKIQSKIASKIGGILASIFWAFWYQLGSILDLKIHEKSMPRGFQDASFFWSILVSISNAFWLRFGGQLASNLGPKTRQDGARSRPGGVQNRGKMELPSQDAPESDLDAILEGFWERFGMIFDGFSMDFL